MDWCGALIEPNPDHRAASAAWLVVLLERIDNGQLPFAGVDDSDADSCSQCQREQERIAAHTLDPASYYDFVWDEKPASPLVDSLLHRLLAAVKGQPWEETFWDQVLPSVYNAIPDDIAEDLLDRGVSIHLLGHQPLSDRMLFRLIDVVDEALLTLAKRRYIHDRYDADAFEEVLYASPKHEWMLSSLIMLQPSHVEKAQRLAIYIAKCDPPLKWPPLVNETFQEVWDARSSEAGTP